MKNLALALLFALSLATVAHAADFKFTGCTVDKQAVVIEVTVDDDLSKSHPAVDHIAKAFTKTASGLLADELQSGLGFTTFVGNLDEEDIKAVVAIMGAPQVTGRCQ